MKAIFFLKTVFWGVLTLFVADMSWSIEFPSKPIRLINPFSSGGSSDLVARIVSQRLTEALGQPVILENRPGGGTSYGTEIVVKSLADGYTLLQATSPLAINVSLYKKLPFDPLVNLVPIGLIAETVNVLAVNNSVKANNVRELIEVARANPGGLSYGSSGNGATNHLGMELFKSMANVDIIHIPYKGGAQAVNDLLGDHIQVMLNPSSTLLQYHKVGKLKVIAIGSRKRMAGLNLPTISESGLPGFESTVWYSLFAPAGTSRSIILRLNAEINLMLKDKIVLEQLEAAGLYPIGGTPEELGKLLRDEIDRWAKVVRESGAKVD